MTSLADAIRSFQRGGLSQQEFFARVEEVLARGQASRAELLEILEQERARYLLPSETYAGLLRRIEQRAVSRQSLNGDETPIHSIEHPNHPNTREDRQSSMPTEAPGSAAAREEAAEPGAERMKGVGDTLNGRFVLEECIGFGGMGTVYRALDLRKLEASDRKPYIAIKVLNVQFRGHPKSLIALQREAKKAQALAHPNIVTVYDFDRDGTMVYLTMEYLSGKPLSRTVRAQDFAGMPYGKALRIVNGIARALAYAHERGFVHCDLKPANVFVTDSGEVKVIDFGIARVFQKPQEEVEATVFDPGSLGGMTPAYASPEMIDHKTPDPRDDIYALGCITYELLTGRHPFGRLPANQARAAGMKPQRPKNLGLRQWRALRQSLSFERESRTPNVARFLRDLGEERRPGLSMALAASLLMAAVLLAAAVGYFWKTRGGTGDEPVIASDPVESAGQAAGDGKAAEQADASAQAGAAPSSSSPSAPPSPPSPPSPSAAASSSTAPSQGAASQAPPPPAPAPPPPPKLEMAAVTPVLAGIPCSALAAAIDGGTLKVEGYVSGDYGNARLKEILGAIPGAANVNLDVQPVTKEKCGPVATLAPYWADNIKAGHAATLRTKAPDARLQGGDPLVVDITTPGYDSWVYVDYYAMDGSVVHLVPSPRARAHQAPPSYSATIGSMGNWVIAPPFGTELVVLLISPEKLFNDLRPEAEDGAGYVRDLEKRLGEVAKKAGPGRIAADFVQITTRARKP